MKKRLLTALPAILLGGVAVGLCAWGIYAKIEHLQNGSKILFSSMFVGAGFAVAMLIFTLVNKPSNKAKA